MWNMFTNIKYRRAFHYWQHKSGAHPLTCSEHSWVNLEIKYIKNNEVCLYCPECNYEQIWRNKILDKDDAILNYYNKCLKNSKIKVKTYFNPRLWAIGVQWLVVEFDVVIMLPMLSIRIYREFKHPYDLAIKELGINRPTRFDIN